MHISDNIKIVRALLKESQDDFRKRFTDITLGKQKSYEQGAANPGFLYVSEIASLAGVSEEDFRKKRLTKEDIKLNRAGEEKDNKDKNVVRGTSENQKVDETTFQASLKALTDMARCNSDLAQAALTRAQADLQREEKEKLLVQSNNRLTELLKPTENIHEVNPLNHPSILSALLQTLAELGIGKYWGSKEEGLVELGNRFALPDDAVEKFENKQAGAGRKSTA